MRSVVESNPRVIEAQNNLHMGTIGVEVLIPLCLLGARKFYTRRKNPLN